MLASASCAAWFWVEDAAGEVSSGVALHKENSNNGVTARLLTV